MNLGSIKKPSIAKAWGGVETVVKGVLVTFGMLARLWVLKSQ
jgi:hypothetical protein